MNHHLLSDFRTAHPERLEQLLVRILATLMDQGLVSLSRVAQDGMRVRASAGGASFRRQGTLVNQLETHFGRRPEEHLADGGFASKQDIEALDERGTTVYTPVRDEEAKRKKGQDPFAPMKGDTPTITRWRERMGTPAGQAIDRLRSSLAEFPNAVFRNRGLRQFMVRGLAKVQAATLWQVLAFNFTRLQSLGWLTRL